MYCLQTGFFVKTQVILLFLSPRIFYNPVLYKSRCLMSQNAIFTPPLDGDYKSEYSSIFSWIFLVYCLTFNRPNMLAESEIIHPETMTNKFIYGES